MSQITLKLPPLSPTYVMQQMSEVYDWGLQDLHIPEIHKQTLGEGITVAVIDSGKSTHFELENNTLLAKNFSESEEVEDKNGHSTIVSGIIAAEKNNQGIIGVAPKAKILFAKAIDDSGSGNPIALAKAILWAIKQNVDIISVSAGMFMNFEPLHNAVKKAYENDIIIIAAVGNTGTRHYDVAYPARYPEVIGVAAYDKKHETAPFSSRGINVSFAMPGVDVYSTWLNNQYVRMSGTSFSAPILSGICALILAKHKLLGSKSKTPCKTPKQMLEHLNKYAIKLDDPKATGFGTIDMKSMFEQEDKTEIPNLPKIIEPIIKPKPKPKKIKPKQKKRKKSVIRKFIPQKIKRKRTKPKRIKLRKRLKKYLIKAIWRSRRLNKIN